jgi:hypothetical protein
MTMAFRSLRLRSVALVGLVVSAAAVLPGCFPPPPPPPTLYGVHQDLGYELDPAERDRAVSQVRQVMRAAVSRSTLAWSSVEAVQGMRDWSIIDDAVSRVQAAGMEPLFVVGNSPSWANGSTDPTVVPPTGAAFDTWLNRYANFVSEAAHRYRGKVKKWQLWNEPNLKYFWRPAPNVGLYVRFYNRLRNVIKAVDSTNQVSMGPVASLSVV